MLEAHSNESPSLDNWLIYIYPLETCKVDNGSLVFRRIDNPKEPLMNVALFRPPIAKYQVNVNRMTDIYTSLQCVHPNYCKNVLRSEIGPWMPAPVLAFRRMNKSMEQPLLVNVVRFLSKYINIYIKNDCNDRIKCTNDITENKDYIYIESVLEDQNETIISFSCNYMNGNYLFGNSSYGCSTCRGSQGTYCKSQILVYNLLYTKQSYFRLAIFDTIWDNGATSRGGPLQLELSRQGQQCKYVRNVKERMYPPDVSTTDGVVLPEKLVYIPNFISDTEEACLVSNIDAMEWSNTKISRRVQHYGITFEYDKMTHGFGATPIPPFLSELGRKCYEMGYIGDIPDQITINEYLPGQGIGFHVDIHESFTDWIASISLNSGCVFEFRKRAEIGEHKTASISRLKDQNNDLSAPGIVSRKYLFLKHGSLTVFSDELRYAWEHGIPGRKYDIIDGANIPRERRISITLRKYKTKLCTCKYFYYCDDRNKLVKEAMKPTHLKEVDSK